MFESQHFAYELILTSNKSLNSDLSMKWVILCGAWSFEIELMQQFLRKLKHRRVLHTASLYVVGAWISLQVAEVLSGAGLPPSTMRNLLVILSCGFPLALIIGWFFDISKEGIVKTGPLKEDEKLPQLKFIDYILLTGLILVVAIDGYILSFPPPSEAPAVASPASTQRTIAVLGFDDLQLAEGDDPVGNVFAGELRSSLTRVAGLRVLGPETSKMLSLAGKGRLVTAKELLVTAMVLGEVLLEGGRIQVNTRLVGVPAGNEIWSFSVEAPVGDAIELQQGLLKQLVGAIAPGLDPDPVQGPRAEVGACSTVYDIYLRGKQLSKARHKTEADRYNRGMELLREAVSIDENCALAWEAIATASLDMSMPGFAKAGAAARRALELNDALPEAWAVLAEIAEEEERWNDSEEYFLRALYADPTNVHVNLMYSEALIARGRVTDAVHHGLEAYRYDPVSMEVHWRLSMAAMYAGDSDLLIKHAEIAREIAGEQSTFYLYNMFTAHLLKGDTDRAIKLYSSIMEQDWGPHWMPDCIRVRDDPSLAPGVLEAVRVSIEQRKSDTVEKGKALILGADIISCATWLGEPDIVFDSFSMVGVAPFPGGTPTEVIFINMFASDASILRQDPRFRELVVESGLLDYWRKWGWSDYCEPDGDSFRCD
jgi:adenylate cyclase